MFVPESSLSFVTAQCSLRRAVAFFPMAGNHLLVTLITSSSITVVHANITVLDCLTLGQKLSHCERDIIPMSQMISYRLRSFSADQTTFTFSSLHVHCALCRNNRHQWIVATISRLNSKNTICNWSCFVSKVKTISRHKGRQHQLARKAKLSACTTSMHNWKVPEMHNPKVPEMPNW